MSLLVCKSNSSQFFINDSRINGDNDGEKERTTRKMIVKEKFYDKCNKLN